MEFAADDELPGRTLDLLRLCIEAAGESLPRTAEIYNEWVQGRTDEPDGTMVSREMDEAVIGKFSTVVRGVELGNGASLYSLWVHQRTLDCFRAQTAEAQQGCRELLGELGGRAVIEIELARPLTRSHSHIALGPAQRA